MSRKVKVVKVNPEPARGTVGVNPSDPWSTKANIAEGSLDTYLLSRGINPKFVSRNTKISHSKSAHFQKWKSNHKFEEVQQNDVESLEEDAMLDRYLSSRGINPRFATKMIKISHAKSHEFEKWKRDHMFENVVAEETDKKDMICMDIPLLIRVLEFTREEMSSDIELHNMVERLINMRHDVPLDMTHYDEITSKLVKEEVLDESPKEGGKRKFSGMYNPAPKGTFAYDQAMRKKKHDEIEKNQSKDGSGMTSAIDRLQAHLNKEETEQLDELKKSTVFSWLKKQPVVPEKKPGMSKKDHNQKIKTHNKSWNRALDRLSGYKPTSENTLDPLAATEAPCDGANGGDESSEKKRQMSKSARMIKALYKKHNMKEEMYDWEKDDKNQTSPGRKKPKLDTTSDESNFGSNKPQARAVMSGGKTLTGEPRDTVEIDPLLKNRPDLNGNTKDETGKKINKINN